MKQQNLIILPNKATMEIFFNERDSFIANNNISGFYPNPIDNRYHLVTIKNPNFELIPGQQEFFTIDDYWDNDVFIPQETNYSFEDLCRINNPTL